jgi:hypothetical protein
VSPALQVGAVHGADETKGSRDSFKNGGVLKQPAKLWVYFVVRNVDTAEQIVGHGVGSQACRLYFSLQSAPVAAEGQLQKNSRPASVLMRQPDV